MLNSDTRSHGICRTYLQVVSDTKGRIIIQTQSRKSIARHPKRSPIPVPVPAALVHWIDIEFVRFPTLDLLFTFTLLLLRPFTYLSAISELLLYQHCCLAHNLVALRFCTSVLCCELENRLPYMYTINRTLLSIHLEPLNHNH